MCIINEKKSDNTPVTEDTPAENDGQTQFKSKAAQIAHQRAEELRQSGHKLRAKIYDHIAAKAEKTQIIDLTKIIDEEILNKKIEEIIANYYLIIQSSKIEC